MLETISLEALLIFARGVCLIGACVVLGWAALRWRKQMACDSQRLFEQVDIALLEMRVMHEHLQRVESRIDALAGQMAEGARQAPQPVAAAASRGYELAVRLAKRGSPAEELVATCGIARHEADLLVRLHSVRVVDNVSQERGLRASSSSAAAPAPAAVNNVDAARPTPRKRGGLLAVG